MANLGEFTLLLALFLSGYAIIADWLGSRFCDNGLMRSGANATIAGWLALSVAIGVLLVAFVSDDFSINYVADHNSIALPLAYKISALWAGAGGSLLLWLWLQVGIVVLFLSFNTAQERSFISRARIFANIISCLFLILLLWDREIAANIDKSLFAASLQPPMDGMGLNPLLQHPAMAMHPPALFIGYASYIAPFIWALSVLVGPKKTDRPSLFLKARNWVLIAWLFLTVGNVLGSWWAYEELGWGGFWAWDPVENSSLMPWLVGTALLHSFKKYKSGTKVARWVIVLCLLSYSFCIFGTYLTRSGLVASVHSFPDPGFANLYLALLVLFWIAAGYFALRQKHLSSDNIKVEPIKGSGIITLINWLFIVLVVVILLGTLFPAISHCYIKLAPHLPYFCDHVPPSSITLKPDYFTKITAPGGMLLLLLIAACPNFFQWGAKSKFKLAQLAIMALVAFVFHMTSQGWALPCLILGGYAGFYILVDMFVRIFRKSKSEGNVSSGRAMSWYGARLAHLGVVFMFLAMAAAEGYGTEQAVVLHKNQSAKIADGDYEVTFEGLSTIHDNPIVLSRANVAVKKNGEFLAQLTPALASHMSGQQTSEADVLRKLTGDLYLSLTAIDPEREAVNLRVLIKPMINWLWIGGGMMTLGAAMALISWGRNRKQVL